MTRRFTLPLRCTVVPAQLKQPCSPLDSPLSLYKVGKGSAQLFAESAPRELFAIGKLEGTIIKIMILKLMSMFNIAIEACYTSQQWLQSGRDQMRPTLLHSVASSSRWRIGTQMSSLCLIPDC